MRPTGVRWFLPLALFIAGCSGSDFAVANTEDDASADVAGDGTSTDASGDLTAPDTPLGDGSADSIVVDSGTTDTGLDTSPSDSTVDSGVSDSITFGEADVVTTDGPTGALVLATGLNGPRGITLDDYYVYVACAGSGTVVRIPKTGGGATTLATGVTSAEAVAVDGTYVYVTYDGGTGSTGGSMGRLPKAGGTVTAFGAAGTPGQIVTDTTDVYWTTITDHAVRRYSKSTATATEWHRLSTAQPTGIALDASYVYFVRMEAGGARKIKTALAGDPHENLVSGGGFGAGPPGNFLAAGTTYLFWAEHAATGSLWRGPKVPASPLAPASAMQASNYFHGVALDSSNVYWIRGYPPSTIVKAAADGSSPVDLRSAGNHGWGLAIDATYVYWSSNADGTVSRAPR